MSPTLLNPKTRSGRSLSAVRPAHRRQRESGIHSRRPFRQRGGIVGAIQSLWRRCRAALRTAWRRFNEWAVRVWFQPIRTFRMWLDRSSRWVHWTRGGTRCGHLFDPAGHNRVGILRPGILPETQSQAKEIFVLSLCIAVLAVVFALSFWFCVDGPEWLGWDKRWQ